MEALIIDKKIAARSAGLVVLTLASLLGGCAIQAMEDRNKADAQRVDRAQDDLRRKQEYQRLLLVQQDKLRQQQRDAEVNAAQLRQQLDELTRLNANSAAANDQQRAAKAQRAAQLSDVQQQTQAVDRDTTLSREQKQRKLKALQERTLKLLDVMASQL